MQEDMSVPVLRRQRGPLEHGFGWYSPKVSSEFRERPCLKRKVESNGGRLLISTSALHMHAHKHPWTHTHAIFHPFTEQKLLLRNREYVFLNTFLRGSICGFFLVFIF